MPALTNPSSIIPYLVDKKQELDEDFILKP